MYEERGLSEQRLEFDTESSCVHGPEYPTGAKKIPIFVFLKFSESKVLLGFKSGLRVASRSPLSDTWRRRQRLPHERILCLLIDRRRNPSLGTAAVALRYRRQFVVEFESADR
jgi:hypothetical protein